MSDRTYIRRLMVQEISGCQLHNPCCSPSTCCHLLLSISTLVSDGSTKAAAQDDTSSTLKVLPRQATSSFVGVAHRQLLTACIRRMISQNVSVTALCLSICLHFHFHSHMVQDDFVLQREFLRILYMDASSGRG